MTNNEPNNKKSQLLVLGLVLGYYLCLNMENKCLVFVLVLNLLTIRHLTLALELCDSGTCHNCELLPTRTTTVVTRRQYVRVHALKGKRLELSTPSLVCMYSTAVAQYALTRRSKDQEVKATQLWNHRGRMVASEMCCCGRVLLLPVWDCTSYECLSF